MPYSLNHEVSESARRYSAFVGRKVWSHYM